MSRKTFVLDTNVLLLDVQAVLKFPNSDVVLPVTVIEELDKLKRAPGTLGKNARSVIRLLDELRGGEGNMHSRVSIPGGATLRIELDIKKDYDDRLALSVNDNKIILAAYLLKEQGNHTVFVSKDLAARIKAEAIGLEAEDYLQFKSSYEQLYRGCRELSVEKTLIDQFLANGAVSLQGQDFRPNECCVLDSPENSHVEARYCADADRLLPLGRTQNIWGLDPRNMEQRFALDMLLREDIKLCCLVGPAGTGKTLLALAAGLRMVFDEGAYHKILVSRPIIPLGRDIGYLPGTKEEKLYHWMQPIYDNLEFLCSAHGGDNRETLQWILDSKKIEMEAVTYIRGRSLPKIYFIIDEAQNLSPHEVKTIISRAGEGTKVILTGDPTQIDHPYLDKDSNAITHTINHFKDQKLFGTVFLERTERSDLAALATRLM